MKKIVLLSSLILFVLSISAFAQQRFTPQDRLKFYKEKLNLTEDQSKKVEQILIKSDDQMKKLREDKSADRSEFRKMMDQTNQEISKVLNEKQKADFQKMLDEMKARRNRQ